MHFATSITISLLPLSTLIAALPAPQDNADMTPETITTSSGEERTVYFDNARFKRDQSPNPAIEKRVEFWGDRVSRNFCRDTSFKNKSSGGSPRLADCECLRDAFRGKKGYWKVHQDDPYLVSLGKCGTCKFGVETDNFFGTIVGNSDAADVLRDSITKFKWEGKVGAEGYMGCYNAFELAGTDWAIFQ